MRFDTITLFLWGYAKDCVYADKPPIFEHLKIKIRQIMAEIPSKLGREVLTVSDPHKFIAELRETGFFIDVSRREHCVHPKIPKLLLRVSITLIPP